MKKALLYISIFLLSSTVFAQNKIDINAVFDLEETSININQFISYKNESNVKLDTIYLSDWSNSFSTKVTPLAKRFAEEYSTKFHFAKNEDRGFTAIISIQNESTELSYERLQKHPDVIKVVLSETLKPGESYKLNLSYIIKLPNDKFTGYGISPFQELNLKYWYITPAVFDGQWHYFSNKDLNDLYVPKADITLQFEFPRNYVLTSELDLIETTQKENSQTFILSGKDRVNTKLFLSRFPKYKTIQTDNFSVISDITEKDLEATDMAVITDKVTQYIEKHLGDYPHEKLLVTEIDASKDPIYGLNQLPDFIRPFPKNFKYELTLLKNTIGNFLDNTLLINPRKEQWLKDGIQIYFLIKYIEENYPDMKLLGSFANMWGVRAFHAADLNFNDQYGIVYMHMARTNRDQPIGMAKDSLLKFNQRLANKYKAGVGLKYLDDFVNANILEASVKEFLTQNKVKPVKVKDFELYLKSKTDKDINWFFNDYINTRKKIDFKIKKVEKSEDSITLTIKNKKKNNMPVSLFALNNDSIISKTWVTNIKDEKTITIPRNEANKLVLNYDQTIPEYNLRDNWKSLKGFFFNSKPLQFRLFKDFEDPNYSQVFLMPQVEFKNIYDGITTGLKVYNKTLLRKQFSYKFSPQYATKSKTFTGSASLFYTHNVQNKDLFRLSYGVHYSFQSYAEGLFFRKLTPSLSLTFRDKDDLRSNKRQYLNFRYLDINRDKDVNNISEVDDPNYNVMNIRYVYSDDNLINYKKWFADFQVAKTFGKISFNYEYRKLFESNRQLNIRLFGGTFLYNRNPEGFDYFNFALDRPTDYLFDYNYLGRSEASGIYSQQLIIAEGGFKSKLETPFANQWIATANVSTTIWRYIQAYGDIGFVKNRYNDPKFVYDSGIRLNLVTDYFEVYFPVYSNLGWEISQAHYDQKIRFVLTVDPQTLLGLFRRKWY
ncbi:MAG: metalloprotease [Bacteroidia bacterium]|nr:metalloprotease [Bacteroidia bacterium]NNL34185.1 metalloprotease [Flavobacteriaceae bacterium]